MIRVTAAPGRGPAGGARWPQPSGGRNWRKLGQWSSFKWDFSHESHPRPYVAHVSGSLLLRRVVSHPLRLVPAISVTSKGITSASPAPTRLHHVPGFARAGHFLEMESHPVWPFVSGLSLGLMLWRSLHAVAAVSASFLLCPSRVPVCGSSTFCLRPGGPSRAVAPQALGSFGEHRLAPFMT